MRINFTSAQKLSESSMWVDSFPLTIISVSVNWIEAPGCVQDLEVFDIFDAHLRLSSTFAKELWMKCQTVKGVFFSNGLKFANWVSSVCKVEHLGAEVKSQTLQKYIYIYSESPQSFLPFVPLALCFPLWHLKISIPVCFCSPVAGQRPE